ncbi:hypothetical protein [Aneurinibacillus migulanus]|uniref:hypothetical protein n=1 Tax=Aneurinibacillus migulanus TaxID=47500 RepID=UPI00209D5AFE|nr:hypothetical protein [Aneurinibacillus migulanus]MCP1354612.1 hypothetical protein [Aneurinibacillus migulanus]
MYYLNIRNHNEKVPFFNDKFTKIYNVNPTLDYNGAPYDYEDPADYIRTGPVRVVRFG